MEELKSPDASGDAPETFDALRQRIRDKFPDLSPHLRRIARASLEEPNSFALNTTLTIAATLDIQPSALIRFAKEFGYSGFSGMQRVFRQRLIEGVPTVREQVYTENVRRLAPPDLKEILETCVAAHVESLHALLRTCSPEKLAEAVERMRSARHIYIAGLRRSRPIASYLAYGLIRSERPCSLLDFAGGMASSQISTMSSEDLLVVIAFPPYSQPVVDAVMDANVSGRRVLAITDGPGSPLARQADTSLFVDAGATSQLQPISAPIGLVQTLVTALGQYQQGAAGPGLTDRP